MPANQHNGVIRKGPKITKRTMQAIETRNRIYEIAIKIMQSDEFENMTVGQISETAQVSVGAFYHHCKSKYDILDEVFDRADIYFENQVVPNLAGATTVEKIVNYLCHYVEFDEQQGIDHIKALYATQSALFNKKARFMISGLNNMIQRGIQIREIQSDLNSEEITEFLFVTVRGITFNWCLRNGDFSLTERMLSYITFQMKLFSAQANTI